MDRAIKHSPEEWETLDEFIEEFAKLAQYNENQTRMQNETQICGLSFLLHRK